MSTTLAFDIIARDRASDKFDKIGSSAGRSTDKLKKFAVVGAAAAAAGAVMLGKALVDMTRAAIEDEASQAKLATSLRNAAGATKGQVAAAESWITAQGKALGIADDELRPALSKLAVATGDVGKAQRLTALAMDVSAGTGKSLASVTDALMKAQNGSLVGLSRMGVATKNAAGETKSLAQVTADLARLHGGQAATQADTTAGKMRRLRLMYDEAKESIGARLIPVATKLADFALNRLAPALGKVGDWIQQKVVPAFQRFASDVAPKARETMERVKQAFQDARPFLELMGRALTGFVLPALGKLAKVNLTVLDKQLEFVGKALGNVGKAGTIMWNSALQPAFRHMVDAIGTVLQKLGDMFSALGSIKGAPAWIGKTGAALQAAATKAKSVADNITRIPTSKTVNITVAYRYEGLKSPTRGRDDDFGPSSRMLGRLAQPRAMQSLGDAAMAALAKGMKSGGKKTVEVLGKVRDDLRSKLDTIKSDMKSLSDSVASAFNADVFGGTLDEMFAGLTGNNSNLTALLAAFDKLKGMGASSSFLSGLFQSGNTSLALGLAGGSATQVQQASGLFDQNAALAGQLGDKVAMDKLAPEIAKAVAAEVAKLKDEMRDAPRKTAKELREVIKDIRIELTGGSAGQRAYLRTGRN